jgi:hypothetical protein
MACSDARRLEVAEKDQASNLRARTEAAPPEVRSDVDPVLTGAVQQRDKIEHDIAALKTVQTRNLGRSRSVLKQELSQLDKTLDRAESQLY